MLHLQFFALPLVLLVTGAAVRWKLQLNAALTRAAFLQTQNTALDRELDRMTNDPEAQLDGPAHVFRKSLGAVSDAWKEADYPIKQLRIDLEGTRRISDAELIAQLQHVAARVLSGLTAGEDHADSFGYRFEYHPVITKPIPGTDTAFSARISTMPGAAELPQIVRSIRPATRQPN